jgi:CheY-like chemotaxis protein
LTTAPPSPAIQQNRGMALLAEDSSANAAAFSALLRQCGFEVKIFIDGKAMWDYLEKISATDFARLKIIFSDFMMPRMDGMELLRKLRATPKLKAVPFVFCTAVLDPKLIREALPLSQGYIVKPANLSLLQKKVTELLGPAKP